MELFSKQYSTSGQTVIILHGLFGNQANWTTHAKRLSEHYQVYAFDARNHGRSPWCDEMSYSAMAQDVIQTMDALSINKAHFIAHSMGGKTAMQLALIAPERIDKLIVVDIAPVDYPRESSSVLDALQAINIETLQSREQANQELAKMIDEKPVRDFLLGNLQRDSNKQYSWRFNLEALVKCFSTIKSWPDNQSIFQRELLYIKGASSDYILPEHQEQTLRQFPKAKMKVINNAGHWVHSEKPEAFMKIVENYLND